MQLTSDILVIKWDWKPRSGSLLETFEIRDDIFTLNKLRFFTLVETFSMFQEDFCGFTSWFVNGL